MSLFRRKDVSTLQAEVAADQSLKRVLGPVNLVLLGIGAVIALAALLDSLRRR